MINLRQGAVEGGRALWAWNASVKLRTTLQYEMHQFVDSRLSSEYLVISGVMSQFVTH